MTDDNPDVPPMIEDVLSPIQKQQTGTRMIEGQTLICEGTRSSYHRSKCDPQIIFCLPHNNQEAEDKFPTIKVLEEGI